MSKKIIMYSAEREDEIQAIQDSIEHWKKDILKPLQDGEKIDMKTGTLYWENGHKVKCYDTDCSLCILVHNDCYKCPLTEYGCHTEVENSPYKQFIFNPCLETAQNMVMVLQDTLVKYLTEEEICIKKEIELKDGLIIKWGNWYFLLRQNKGFWILIGLTTELTSLLESSKIEKSPWFTEKEMIKELSKRDFEVLPNAIIKIIEGDNDASK